MTKQNFAVIDLGFGDSGKGTIVDALVKKHDCKLVVRFNGGAQAAHNVIDNGRHHTFSQLGSGMFKDDVDTYLSKFMFVQPEYLRNEVFAFCNKVNKSIPVLTGRVFLDEDCCLITPFHKAVNEKLEESNKHGSCGIGFGVAVKDSIDNPNLVIRVRDIGRRSFVEKMTRLSKTCEKYKVIINGITEYFDACDWMIKTCRVVSSDFLKDRLASGVVFEGAQGILLDQDFGFHPHTAWSSTGSKNIELLTNGKWHINKIGVVRSYCTRHGNGPMPTDGTLYRDEPYNKEGKFQGLFRTGVFDLNLFKYAITCNPVHSLAITHLDTKDYRMCTGYEDSFNLKIPTDIIDQCDLRKKLSKVKCIIENKKCESIFIQSIERLTFAKVSIKSYGPEYKDKDFV